MKAVLVAGGHGSRLLPMTKFTHKTLLPLCGRPIIDYTVILRELARGFAVDYALLDAIQSDNAALREILTGKTTDVITGDD